MDDRLIQRLEEQLRDSHATNADLREQLVEIKKRAEAANTLGLRGQEALDQLEKAHAKQKKAEVNAAAAQRKVAEAERELLRTRAELEELQVRFERVREEAVSLNELNARIETAKHAGDLFS